MLRTISRTTLRDMIWILMMSMITIVMRILIRELWWEIWWFPPPPNKLCDGMPILAINHLTRSLQATGMWVFRDGTYRRTQRWTSWLNQLKGMVHMTTMLVPIDVFVYWEYDKNRETSHTSLFKPIGQGRCPMSLVRCPIDLRRCPISILIGQPCSSDRAPCLSNRAPC